MILRVITVSDRVSSGVRADESGPLLVELLGGGEPPVVVPDDADTIAAAVRAAIAEGVDAVITTGGTGISPRDVTPEAVAPLLEKELPGILEAIRAAGPPTAVLSRGVAGTVGRTLVVTLPGSTGGVRDGATVIAPLLAHIKEQLAGGDH